MVKIDEDQMAKKSTKAKKAVKEPVEMYVDVQGYNVSQVFADRNTKEPVALIRLLRKAKKEVLDVGYVLFFPDGSKLPPDSVHNIGTKEEAILMHAHTIDYERILDLVRNEDPIRLYFTGKDEHEGIAEIRSLRENF